MKLRITESQLTRLKENISGISDKYVRNLKVNFNNLNKIKYKGFDVNYIDDVDTLVNFDIDVEYKKWGINGIDIINIEGSNKLEVVIYYYNEKDEEFDETTIINLDWDKIEKNVNPRKGVITVDNLELYLDNSESGDIIVTHGSIDVYQ